MIHVLLGLVHAWMGASVGAVDTEGVITAGAGAVGAGGSYCVTAGNGCSNGDYWMEGFVSVCSKKKLGQMLSRFAEAPCKVMMASILFEK